MFGIFGSSALWLFTNSTATARVYRYINENLVHPFLFYLTARLQTSPLVKWQTAINMALPIDVAAATPINSGLKTVTKVSHFIDRRGFRIYNFLPAGSIERGSHFGLWLFSAYIYQPCQRQSKSQHRCFLMR